MNEQILEPATNPTLDSPLASLPLPTRVLTWASRVGARTLRDLVAKHPALFAHEPNIGSGTVARARMVIESRLGRTWEELAQETRPGDGPMPAQPELSDQTPWDQLALTLPADLLQIQLAALVLPARLRTYCREHGIVTVRRLLDVPSATLDGQRNLGQVSIEECRRMLVDLALRAEVEPRHASAMASLTYHVARLDSAPRAVIVRRAGLLGRSQKLVEIGEELELTGERIRQIESEAIACLRRSSTWLARCCDQLSELVGQSTLLTDLEGDPWWSDLGRDLETLVYFLERILQTDIHLVVIGEKRILSRLSQAAADELWDALASEAQAWNYPLTEHEIQKALEHYRTRAGDGLASALGSRLRGNLRWSGAGETPGDCVALAFGHDRGASIHAYLEAQSAPVPVANVHAAVGRGSFPESVLYFARGVVGLRKHFTDFDQWLHVVPRSCVQIMEESDPTRQWHVVELLEALRETNCVPDSFNHWNIASLLRHSDEVDYLGRLRVSLPQESDAAPRILFADAVREALTERGAPMTVDAIAVAVRIRTDIRDATLVQTLRAPEFVQMDEQTWGLVDRDLPGGVARADGFLEVLANTLEEQEHGLDAEQLRSFASNEQECSAWTPEMASSLVRADPRFRNTRAGGTGLFIWETARVQASDDSPDSPREAPMSEEQDPPRQILGLAEIKQVLKAYKLPMEPTLEIAISDQVIGRLVRMVEEATVDELIMVEKYVDDVIQLLLRSDEPWIRELGDAVMAIRQLQLLERSDGVTLSTHALRHIRAGLFYLVDRDDVIPDATPETGYLDDAHAIAWCCRVVGNAMKANPMQA